MLWGRGAYVWPPSPALPPLRRGREPVTSPVHTTQVDGGEAGKGWGLGQSFVWFRNSDATLDFVPQGYEEAGGAGGGAFGRRMGA